MDWIYPNSPSSLVAALRFQSLRLLPRVIANTGDVKLQNTANNTQAAGIGGIIGHAGGVALDDATAYTITIDNCAVRNCDIDGLDTGTYTQSGVYAAPFIGKVSPQGTNYSIKAKASYVSNVKVSGNSARRFLGVGSYNESIKPQSINLVAVNLNEVDENGDVIDWNASCNANSQRVFNTTDTFTQTDGNMITGGTAGYVQQNDPSVPNKVRFASSLDDSAIGNLEQVGYIITASYGAGEVHGWVKTSTTVYPSLLANNGLETVTASSLHSGDDWIFALTVTEIPSGLGDVTFKVTPFVVKNDGTILFGRTGSSVISVGSL